LFVFVEILVKLFTNPFELFEKKLRFQFVIHVFNDIFNARNFYDCLHCNLSRPTFVMMEELWCKGLSLQHADSGLKLP